MVVMLLISFHQLAQEARLVPQTSTILTFTDNKSLYESANTTSLIADRRLRVELSAIREMQERGEITIQWINKEKQLADCLTKKGAPCNSIMSVLQTAKLDN